MTLSYPSAAICPDCSHHRSSRPQELGADGLVSRIACEKNRTGGNGLTEIRSQCENFSHLVPSKKVA